MVHPKNIGLSDRSEEKIMFHYPSIIQSIALLKLDAELADWQILNGIKAQDWQRIRQVAMEVHVESDLTPVSQFFSERDFSQVSGKKWRGGDWLYLGQKIITGR
jgi:hypothetical protein